MLSKCERERGIGYCWYFGSVIGVSEWGGKGIRRSFSFLNSRSDKKLFVLFWVLGGLFPMIIIVTFFIGFHLCALSVILVSLLKRG